FTQSLARAIVYENVASAPDASDRTIAFTVNDGDGGTSAALTRVVHVEPFSQGGQSQTTTFTESAGGPWETSGFWDNGLPGVGYDAVIPDLLQGPVTHTTGNDTFDGLSVEGSLIMSGGTI